MNHLQDAQNTEIRINQTLYSLCYHLINNNAVEILSIANHLKNEQNNIPKDIILRMQKCFSDINFFQYAVLICLRNIPGWEALDDRTIDNQLHNSDMAFALSTLYKAFHGNYATLSFENCLNNKFTEMDMINDKATLIQNSLAIVTHFQESYRFYSIAMHHLSTQNFESLNILLKNPSSSVFLSALFQKYEVQFLFSHIIYTLNPPLIMQMIETFPTVTSCINWDNFISFIKDNALQSASENQKKSLLNLALAMTTAKIQYDRDTQVVAQNLLNEVVEQSSSPILSSPYHNQRLAASRSQVEILENRFNAPETNRSEKRDQLISLNKSNH